MLVRFLWGLMAAMWSIATAHAADLALDIDPSAAIAVLDALETPTLSLERARTIAKLPGNQGLIRKARSYGRAADDESFALALLAAARGDSNVPDPSRFDFRRVRPHVKQLRVVIAALQDPATGRIEAAKRRIAEYTPMGLTGRITGYFVVGGTSGGFAFGEPSFFLNIDYFPDAALATTILEHELYHAVQNTARNAQKQAATATSQCLTRIAMPTHMDDLFDSLVAEGTASAVGDVLALPKTADGVVGEERRKVSRNVGMVDRSVTLLELSAHAVATGAIDFDKIYELGFYGDEILYALGYVIAKAIEREQGPAAIADLTRHGSGAVFIDRYRQLKAYGSNDDTPALGPKTLDWARRMAACTR